MSHKVSIITPTYNRESFHPLIHKWVEAQDYPNIEWLILDDSPQPSRYLADLNNRHIRYRHLPQKISIGEKRNRLVADAGGDIIVHFDDDDYYAPNYISSMIDFLKKNNSDAVNLRGWFLLDKRSMFFGYWQLEIKEGVHYECAASGTGIVVFNKENDQGLTNSHLGYGFGYVYKKAVWASFPFPDKNWNEDAEFMLSAQTRFKLDGVFDTKGICLHVLHANAANTSRCYPQFHLPQFIFPKYFANAQGI